MQYIDGDIFEYHKQPNSAICIPTNGIVKRNGELVMGAGMALLAKQKFPELPYRLGRLVKENGLRVEYFPEYRLFAFPTKQNWKENGDIELIRKSAFELDDSVHKLGIKKVYLPRVGAGLGKLDWREVHKNLNKILDSDRYYLVSFGKMQLDLRGLLEKAEN